jgi:hypothetical protein
LGIHLDIGTAQADCFSWAETAACEYADQRGVGVRPQLTLATKRNEET